MTRRKSNTEKRASGTSRQDRNHSEPEHTPGAPRCPTWVTGYARTVYRRTCRILSDAGAISPADRESIATFAVSVARWRQSEAALDACGSAYQKTKSGYSALRAEAIESRRAREEVARNAERLGLSPTSRARLTKVQSNTDTPNPFTEFNRWAINPPVKELVS